MAAASVPLFERAEPSLGRIVLYHAKDGDDTPEVVPYPLCSEVQVFAAIVTRVYGRGVVDLMVLDPSKGPMPRWGVHETTTGEDGHWASRPE
jgi:hypothetical protein